MAFRSAAHVQDEDDVTTELAWRIDNPGGKFFTSDTNDRQELK